MDDQRLRFGDVVRLSIAQRGAVMFIRGEGHVQMNLTAVDARSRQGPDTEFLFQIIPELSHQAANERRSMHLVKRRSNFARGRSQSAILRSSGAESDVAEAVKAEDRKNKMTLAALDTDVSVLKIVEFSDAIQLRHVNSRRFVTRCTTSLRLELAECDDVSSVFKVQPKHAFRGEGDAVLLTDEIYFASPEIESTMIMLGDEIDLLEGGLPPPPVSREPSPSPVKSLLLSEKQTGSGDEGTSFRLELYSRIVPDERRCVLLGAPLRLWHSDASCFLAASVSMKRNEMAEAGSRREQNFAYLQGSRDATVERDGSPDAVWAIEPAPLHALLEDVASSVTGAARK